MAIDTNLQDINPGITALGPSNAGNFILGLLSLGMKSKEAGVISAKESANAELGKKAAEEFAAAKSYKDMLDVRSKYSYLAGNPQLSHVLGEWGNTMQAVKQSELVSEAGRAEWARAKAQGDMFYDMLGQNLDITNPDDIKKFKEEILPARKRNEFRSNWNSRMAKEQYKDVSMIQIPEDFWGPDNTIPENLLSKLAEQGVPTIREDRLQDQATFNRGIALGREERADKRESRLAQSQELIDAQRRVNTAISQSKLDSPERAKLTATASTLEYYHNNGLIGDAEYLESLNRNVFGSEARIGAIPGVRNKDAWVLENLLPQEKIDQANGVTRTKAQRILFLEKTYDDVFRMKGTKSTPVTQPAAPQSTNAPVKAGNPKLIWNDDLKKFE